METKGTVAASCSLCGHREIVMQVNGQFSQPVFICRACVAQIEAAFQVEDQPPTTPDRDSWRQFWTL